jgi:endonuclease/exonuclease/phosphatase family metal-dependent hydrolase
VPIMLPDGAKLHVLAWHATPPVFDGPEDRNGRRNHDEAAFWLHLLEGELPFPPPDGGFVLMGDANLDTDRSDGRTEAMRALLASPFLQDARPQGAEAMATADFSANTGPGKMRVDYVLPSAGLKVLRSGVLWPGADDALRETALSASRHRLVWVDLDLP